MGKAATIFYKRLASMMSDRRDVPYDKTVNWIRCHLTGEMCHMAKQWTGFAATWQERYAIWQNSELDSLLLELHSSKSIHHVHQGCKIITTSPNFWGSSGTHCPPTTHWPPTSCRSHYVKKTFHYPPFLFHWFILRLLSFLINGIYGIGEFCCIQRYDNINLCITTPCP